MKLGKKIMNTWYEHRGELFNLNNFTIICKSSDIIDYGTEVYQILLSTNKCNTEAWKMDEHSTFSFEKETERDKVFEEINKILTKTDSETKPLNGNWWNHNRT